MQSGAPVLLVDFPAQHVCRLSLNRPEKRNALSNALRGAIFAALEEADRNKDIRVSIIRGAGTCFSAGYDLSRETGNAAQGLPFLPTSRQELVDSVTNFLRGRGQG